MIRRVRLSMLKDPAPRMENMAERADIMRVAAGKNPFFISRAERKANVAAPAAETNRVQNPRHRHPPTIMRAMASQWSKIPFRPWARWIENSAGSISKAPARIRIVPAMRRAEIRADDRRRREGLRTAVRKSTVSRIIFFGEAVILRALLARLIARS